MNKILSKRVQRYWFYFRMGHGLYLALLMSMSNTIIIQYYFVLNRLPILSFLNLVSFSIVFILLYGITSTLLGWIHKRGQIRTDVSVSVEENPYNYSIIPGKEERIYVPLQLFLLRMNKLLLGKLELLTPELGIEFSKYDSLIQKLLRHEEVK